MYATSNTSNTSAASILVVLIILVIVYILAVLVIVAIIYVYIYIYIYNSYHTNNEHINKVHANICIVLNISGFRLDSDRDRFALLILLHRVELDNNIILHNVSVMTQCNNTI